MFEKFFNGGARERMERKLVSTVDLDRILNHFGELPRLSELSQDRQKKWRERNLLMRQIIERCRQDTVKSAMKDSWKEWHEDPGVMQELSELFVQTGLLAVEDLPDAVHLRGDRYTYIYEGEDFLVDEKHDMIAPLIVLETRVLRREEMLTAESLVHEAMGRLCGLGRPRQATHIYWEILSPGLKERIGQSPGPQASLMDPARRRINLTQKVYAYPGFAYPDYPEPIPGTNDRNEYNRFIWRGRASRLKPDAFTSLATTILNLVDDVPPIHTRINYSGIVRKVPLDPVQDFLYRAALAFEVRSETGRQISSKQLRMVQEMFKGWHVPSKPSIYYRDIENPFTPLLEILATGVCPLGLDGGDTYRLLMVAE